MNHFFSNIYYHLLSSITIAFSLGIAATPFLFPAFRPNAFTVAFLLFFLVIISVFHLFHKRLTVFILLIFLFFGIGFYHAKIQSYPPVEQGHIWNIINDKQEAIIIGTLTAMPAYNGESSKIQIAVNFLRLRNWDSLRPAKGDILLRMDGVWPDRYFPGDVLAIRADLKRPSSFHSPGSFDFSQYLARKDIWITGFIRSPLFLQKLPGNNSIFHKLRYLPEKIRDALGREIDTRVSPKLSSFYRAILLGDRSRITNTILEQFKAGGVMHILAISGIHMSVIGILLFGLFYRLLSLSETILLKLNVKKSAALLCLPLLIFYSLITGLNPPVVRSVIMSTVIIGSICVDRKKSPAEILSSAAFLILIFSPQQLFTASFQLSFSAVAAILFILPSLKQLLTATPGSELEPTTMQKTVHWIIAGLLVSMTATLATAPLSLYYFNRISLVGPLTNLIVEPLICLWGLTWGFMALPFFSFLPEIGALLLKLGGLGLSLALEIVRLVSSLSFADVRLPTPPLLLIFFYYSLFMVLTLQANHKKQLSLWSSGLFCLALVFFFYPPASLNSKHFRSFTISFLDVGQGSSTFLEFPSGFRVLIDGGGSSYLTTSVGERVIAPFLWQKGISKIDTIIVTHPDADHYNGLPFIIENFSTSSVWSNNLVGHDLFFKQFLRQLKEKDIAAKIATDGLELRKFPEEIRCIANTTGWSEIGSDQDGRGGENSGLIIKACANTICVLFPGDVGKHIEKLLVDKKYSLHSDILLSPHHGSATSNSEQFLRAVQPKYMIVSAGKNRKNNFPHPKLEQLCDLTGIKLLQTGQSGTVEIVVTSEEISIYGYHKPEGNPLATLNRFLITKINSR